jgi:uncharacterized membrane protein YGL010W
MYAVAANWTLRDREQMVVQDPSAASKQLHHHQWYGTGRVLRAAGWIHVLCWYVQIHWGHKVVEGAQPAVMQSLGGALTTAPLFAFYELVWAMGYRARLRGEVKALVDRYTRDLCDRGVSMRACDALPSK